MVCSSADPREELDGAARRGRRLRRQAASVVLTAVLVAVVAALSCGICGAVAVLYRRRRRCGPGPGPGLGPGPGPVCDDDDDEDADGDGTGKTAADGARERPPAAAGTCRPTDHDEDAPDGRDADALRPLLRAQRNCREPARRQPNDKTNARTAHVASAEDDRRGGPDVVMSTAATPAHTGTRARCCPAASIRRQGRISALCGGWAWGPIGSGCLENNRFPRAFQEPRTVYKIMN